MVKSIFTEDDNVAVTEVPSDEVFETTIEEIDGKTLYKINNYSSVINKMFTLFFIVHLLHCKRCASCIFKPCCNCVHNLSE